MKAVTALRVSGEAACARGIFFPKVKCRLVGAARVFSIGLSGWWAAPGPLEEAGSLLDVMECPVCDTGEQWLCKALSC